MLWKKTAVAKGFGFTKILVVRGIAELSVAISPLKTGTVVGKLSLHQKLGTRTTVTQELTRMMWSGAFLHKLLLNTVTLFKCEST